MTLDVIGAGFGRTGTMSLKFALEILGLGPCYHMMEVQKNPGHSEAWRSAIDGAPDWNQLFHGYRSTVDWPSTYFWRDLVRHFSSAKIILSVRPAKTWRESIDKTIFQALRMPSFSPNQALVTHREMVRKIIFGLTFAQNIDDPAHVISIYERHNEEVIRNIDPNRLLIFQASQGWAPLCQFLGKPIPNVNFPHVNSSEEFVSSRPELRTSV
jgi:hypothetical protein